MATVYLETSFFSTYVSVRTNPKIVGWRESSREWWRNEAPKHRLFVSAEVVAEMSDPRFPQREEALELLRGLALLDVSSEAAAFAELLVQEKLMPAPANAGDAIHLAAATVHRLEYVLTWNVKHLANPNKRTHFAIVCMRAGFVPPLIVTPDALVG